MAMAMAMVVVAAMVMVMVTFLVSAACQADFKVIGALRGVCVYVLCVVYVYICYARTLTCVCVHSSTPTTVTHQFEHTRVVRGDGFASEEAARELHILLKRERNRRKREREIDREREK